MFYKWLLIKETSCESAVEIIMIIYKYLNDEEKYKVCEDLSKINYQSSRDLILQRLVSHPICLSQWIPGILAGKDIRKRLIEAAKSVVDGDKQANMNLLQKCFFQTESGNILLQADLCEEIVDTISSTLEDIEVKESIDSCASFVAQIMPVICNDPKKENLQKRTFLRLFKFR